jgi:hypothetical protein
MPPKKTKKKSSPKKPHFIKILWGSEPEPDDKPKLYEFDCERDLIMFWDGVSEAVGWSNANIIKTSLCGMKGRIL